VSFEEFERQTEVACRCGASGVMAGRAVWNEAADLNSEDRLTFLQQVGRERLSRLGDIIAKYGRPWFADQPMPVVEEGWYQAY
jgi:tagatose-1,6-bisphosphate aldolase